jgi:hypothetical protein
MPNALMNERRRLTGGKGVTRGNTTTICMIGRVPAQCNKPTELGWYDERCHWVELRREASPRGVATRGWGGVARQSKNQPNLRGATKG